MWQMDIALSVLTELDSFDLAAEFGECHPCTVRRWERRIHPYRLDGGMERSTLTGEDQLLLSICIYAP